MVIACCFAGRKDRMEVQLKYIIELLKKNIIDRYDIWNFAWSTEDKEFVNSLSQIHPKINVRFAPNEQAKTTASRGNLTATAQIGYFYSKAYDAKKHENDIFIKIDDDVVWIDNSMMEHFIDIRRTNTEPFLISADVINKKVTKSRSHAILQHYKFLSKQIKAKKNLRLKPYSSSKRLSINFCSWLGSDLKHISESFSNRGTGDEDEIQLCSHIPRYLGRENAVLRDFNVVHLSFGTQEPMPKHILNKYRKLANLQPI